MSNKMVATPKRRSVYILLGVITLGFLLLTLFVYLDPISHIDREFSEEIQEHHYAWLDTTMRLISWSGYMPNAVYLTIGSAALFYLFKYRKEALFVLLTLLSGIVSSAAKLLVNRPRPLPGLVRIIENTRQQSFPSGHVLFYIVFFGFITLLMYRLDQIPKFIRWLVGVFCLLLILTVPISRIYLGAHWFTDVMAGFLLGLLCLFALAHFYLKNTTPHR